MFCHWLVIGPGNRIPQRRLDVIGNRSVLVLLSAASCGSGSTVTTGKARWAVYQWEFTAFVCRCGGPCTGSGGSP